jgi:hypothetical protein
MSRNTASPLRRVVADLAALELDDLRAILGLLTSEERTTIEGLLGEFAGIQAAPVNHAKSWLQADTPDWLGARILSGLTSEERDLALQTSEPHQAQRLRALVSTVRITSRASGTLAKIVSTDAKTFEAALAPPAVSR